MNEIQSTINAFLPHNKKTSPSGWISFNGICCHHNGERPDTRGRGGLLFTDKGFQYHCFNCNYKSGYTYGKLLTSNTKKLFQWLGIPSSEINRLSLYALKMKDDTIQNNPQISFNLVEKQLPDNCRPFMSWVQYIKTKTTLTDEDLEIQSALESIEKYLGKRGMKLYYADWHYAHTPGFKDRVIIPFTHEGKIVGYTGRKIVEGSPKYISDSQSGYLFNIDKQTHDKKFVIVTEGPFDACAVDGIAILTNEPNQIQIQRINSLNKEVIVVPDRDTAGLKLIDVAIEQGWSVSTPPWRENIKDVNDALINYERLYTLYSILHYRESNKLKKELQRKKFQGLIEAIKNLKSN